MNVNVRRFSIAIAVALLAVPATFFPAQAVVGTITETGVVQRVMPQNIGIINAKKEFITVYIDKNTKFIPHKPAVNDKITATGQPEGEGSLLAVTVKIVH